MIPSSPRSLLKLPTLKQPLPRENNLEETILSIEQLKELLHLTKQHLAASPHQQVLSSKELHAYYARFAPAQPKPVPAPQMVIAERPAPVYAKPTLPPKRVEAPPHPLKPPLPEPIVEPPEKKTQTDFNHVREVLTKRFPQIKIRDKTPLPIEFSSKPTIDLYASPQTPEEHHFLERVAAAIKTYGGTPVIHPLAEPADQRATTFVLPRLDLYLTDPAQKTALWHKLKPLLSVPT